jgi:hypothetical protein
VNKFDAISFKGFFSLFFVFFSVGLSRVGVLDRGEEDVETSTSSLFAVATKEDDPPRRLRRLRLKSSDFTNTNDTF